MRFFPAINVVRHLVINLEENVINEKDCDNELYTKPVVFNHSKITLNASVICNKSTELSAQNQKGLDRNIIYIYSYVMLMISMHYGRLTIINIISVDYENLWYCEKS